MKMSLCVINKRILNHQLHFVTCFGGIFTIFIFQTLPMGDKARLSNSSPESPIILQASCTGRGSSRPSALCGLWGVVYRVELTKSQHSFSQQWQKGPHPLQCDNEQLQWKCWAVVRRSLLKVSPTKRSPEVCVRTHTHTSPLLTPHHHQQLLL